MTFAIDPGPLDRALDHACLRLEQCRFADALWARRLDVWTGGAAVEHNIASRLGWLHAIDTTRPHVERLRAFADSIRHAGLSDVVLLGMGGSSLAAEVLRAVIGVARGYPRFQVLDSIDPDAVRHAMADAATSLFIVASKSGSTIEVSALAAEAERRVRAAGATDPGSHFVVITDENTPLHRRAVDQRFRDVFVNPSDVGGRFSALTFFGLVPAALMGVDIDALLASAHAMADACRVEDPRRNPGLALGAVLAAAAASGRDKLTLVLPGRLERFGLWVEQLVAESTGKQGKGIVPVIGEPVDLQSGDDRLVVETNLGGSAPQDPPYVRRPGSAERTRQQTPVVTLQMPDVTALGAEFFRWQMAIATAGFLLDVNPFDEPNVQQAKDATRVLIDAYSSTSRLPVAEPHAVIAGVPITSTAAASDPSRRDAVPALRRLLHAGDYVALLAYLPPDRDPFEPILKQLRTAVARAAGCATTLGYGPRYLHSTGQLHKGGPNTGVFLIVTADPSEDLAVPGEPYSFGVLEMAQAIGDFQSLDRLGRRALHLHLPRRDPALLQQVIARLLGRV